MQELKKLPDEFIDCVVTSPPYWSLRDYGIKSTIWGGDKDCKHDFNPYNHRQHSGRGGVSKIGYHLLKKDVPDDIIKIDGFCKCGAWKGTLGLEPTFDLFIKHLVDIFDEVKRVLKKTGTIWVNLGDTYSGSGKGAGYEGEQKESWNFKKKPKTEIDLPSKCLTLVPFRFAIEMINREWILRNVIIWHKPNCMPSSAKDRFTVDFEYLFFFVKNNKTLYWKNNKTGDISDKQPLGIKGIEGIDWRWDKGKKKSYWEGVKYWFESQYESIESNCDPRLDIGRQTYNGKFKEKAFVTINSQGRNKRTVWRITTKPFKEAHFAVFPEELVTTPIKSGCPEFVCKKCGKAREKIYDEERKNTRPGLNTGTAKSGKDYDPNKSLHTSDLSKYRQQIIKKEKGYTNCNCNAGFEGGIVLDPFSGSGTTCLVAKKLNRNYIGIDINEEYCKMARKRIDNRLGCKEGDLRVFK